MYFLDQSSTMNNAAPIPSQPPSSAQPACTSSYNFKQFNRIARIASLILMFSITLPIALYKNIPNGIVLDYPQYYMGGTIAIHGEWQDLYPIPKPGSMLNPG